MVKSNKLKIQFRGKACIIASVVQVIKSFHSRLERNYFDLEHSPMLEIEEAPHHYRPSVRNRGTYLGGEVGVLIKHAPTLFTIRASI